MLGSKGNLEAVALWIRELEKQVQGSDLNPDKYLGCLLETLITDAPEAALEFIKAQKERGLNLPSIFSPLVEELVKQLLSIKRPRQADELLQGVSNWNIRVSTPVVKDLAKAFSELGDLGKAKLLLSEVLKRDPRSAETIRALYDIARKEGRFDEAHALLNKLIEADGSPGTAAFAFRERKKLPNDHGQSVRIAILSSYVLDPVIHYLDYECRKVRLVPEFYLAPFNQYMQEIINEHSSLYAFKPEIVFLAIGLEDIFPQMKDFPSRDVLQTAGADTIEQLLLLVKELQARSNTVLVVHEFNLVHSSPLGILDNRSDNGLKRWLDHLNGQLAEYLRSQDRAFLLPLTEVLAWIGHERWYDPKMHYMASMRLGSGAFPHLARYSMRYIKPVKGLTRKCIVLDLDGTLWGGIVGEVGPDGIQLGPTAPGLEYMEFQKALLNLTRRGIILTVCSKNNPEDALPVIRHHKHMVLREEHFSAMRINWLNKVENIKELARELNIGLDSIVFMDDNPTERELVRQLLPEVLTVEMPTDPSRYRLVLESMTDFELLAITREDEMRVTQYQAMAKRQAARNRATSLEEYLHSLEIHAEISLADVEHSSRLVQLFNKTNQFNLTTRRYQAADVERFLKSRDHRVYILSVTDRFGDHGLVGVAVVCGEDKRCRIDSLLMSCRVMGLSVETAFLERIYRDALDAGSETLVGEYLPTSKNQPAQNFYAQHGFSLTRDIEGHQFWTLDLSAGSIRKPEWVIVN